MNQKMTVKFKKIFSITSLFVLFMLGNRVYAGTLSCSVTTTCSGGTVIWRMASTANSHAELASQSNYAQLVCCTGVTGLGNSCSGTNVTALKLASTTNAHAEQSSQSNYANNACISVSAGGSVSVGYQATNCSGFDTTLGSMSAVTNAHVGDGSAFATKICATATGAAQSLTFSVSDNSIGFGSLSSGVAAYATGDTLGSASEVEAHQLAVSTNASSGYTITVQGATLTNGAYTVDAIGGTNTTSSPGTEQFGLRMTATGGVGSVLAPYAASGFAYSATAATASQVASAGSGDDVTTTYSVRYIANIGATTETGSYSTALTYVVTANF